MRQANRATPSLSSTIFSPPPRHFFYQTRIAISSQILCGSEISMNNPVNIAIIRIFLGLRDRFYKALKLATKAVKCIVIYKHNFLYTFWQKFI